MMSFSKTIVKWQPLNGRNNLIWQTRQPYDVWLSEIMLQQTQVATVLPRFRMFKARFPTVEDLACSTEEDVLAEWSGLGYYRRAKMLRLCAIELVAYINEHGDWPTRASTWEKFPGIGRSTAAAITSACYGEKVSILDANAKRVIARYHNLDVSSDLWSTAESLIKNLTKTQMPAYTQGLMDIGARYCKARIVDCNSCPLKNGCSSTNRVVFVSPKKPTPVKPQVQLQYALVFQGASILMTQRGDDSFWPSMWTFPEVVKSDKPTFEIRHLLSHRELILQVYKIDVDDHLQGYWIPIIDIKARKISVPSPFVKLLDSI